MQPPIRHVFALSHDELRAWCEAGGMPHFRARQILEWVYERGVADPAAMSNLSKRDRDVLAAGVTFLSGSTVREQLATDGTRKLLIQWTDDPASQGHPSGPPDRASLPVLAHPAFDPSRQTECVMIPSDPEDADPRRTACVSSQVGCPVGCRFCASGLDGLSANLSAGRIVEQVWRLGDLLRRDSDPVGRITNVVFMGMGEPLANMSSVIAAIRTLNTLPPFGLGISARKITISTVGLPKAIEKLAQSLDLPVTLALSLHAPTDELRRSLIPWAEYSTIPELLAACQRWFDKTGREITLEYTLLRSVNDRPEHALELARLARTLRANVNLIRYNEVAGLPFQRPETDDVRAFQAVLRTRGVNAHIRASRGRDIAAACGQLRRESAARTGAA
ncbi:MAG: 23S rRNA (adenine(2503)-C(2))-methyltransferase RlmN [Phycisphaerae bacterium]|nr:23S rRNA (adenine(2503)-C(2))-methyltransferase RlmN [Phycisphaerae bacterium]